MARYVDVDKADVEMISCFYGAECRIEDVKEWLDEQPTADVQEVKHGYWMFNKNPEPDEKPYFCPFCVDGESDSGKDNYCPNCGRRMDMNKE